jgi:hypothetical protein
MALAPGAGGAVPRLFVGVTLCGNRATVGAGRCWRTPGGGHRRRPPTMSTSPRRRAWPGWCDPGARRVDRRVGDRASRRKAGPSGKSGSSGGGSPRQSPGAAASADRGARKGMAPACPGDAEPAHRHRRRASWRPLAGRSGLGQDWYVPQALEEFVTGLRASGALERLLWEGSASGLGCRGNATSAVEWADRRGPRPGEVWGCSLFDTRSRPIFAGAWSEFTSANPSPRVLHIPTFVREVARMAGRAWTGLLLGLMVLGVTTPGATQERAPPAPSSRRQLPQPVPRPLQFRSPSSGGLCRGARRSWRSACWWRWWRAGTQTGGRERLSGLRLRCGSYVAYWDGRLLEGEREVTPGVYYYRLTVDGQSQVKKMIVRREARNSTD